ncbi:hypothetical protein CPB85DRAFT_1307401, partial [Mucidula mucida]
MRGLPFLHDRLLTRSMDMVPCYPKYEFHLFAVPSLLTCIRRSQTCLPCKPYFPDENPDTDLVFNCLLPKCRESVTKKERLYFSTAHDRSQKASIQLPQQTTDWV